MITVYKPEISDFSVNKNFEKVVGWNNQDLASVNLMEKVYPDQEYRKEVNRFMQNPDGRWKDIKLVTKSGEKIQTTWTNIRLSDDTQIGIGIDITKRKNIEEELKRKEEWLQLTTTSSNIGLWEWHPQSGETIFDEMWANLAGYTLEELQPISIETWNSLVHPDDLKLFEQEVERYFAGETSIYECEIRMKHKDGHWVWILDRGRAVEWDDEGNPLKMVGTHVDITYRKNIEERLEEEKQRFKITSSLISDVIYDFDVLQNKTWWNDGITTVFGYPPDTVSKNNNIWSDHVHPAEREEIIQKFRDTLSSDADLWEAEYRFCAYGGEVKYIKEKAFILRNEKNEAVRLIGTVLDLTEERKTKEFLEYHANLLREVSDAVISTDPDFIVKSWNEAAEKTYGWTREEAIGKHLNDLITTTFDGTTGQHAIEELTKNGEWNGEVVQKTRHVGSRNILSSIRLLKNSDGNMTGAVAINRDITERIEVEKENQLLADLFIHSNTGQSVSNHKTNKLERANEAFAKMCGYEADEMRGLDVDELYSSESLKDQHKQIKKLDETGTATFESQMKRKDGSTFPAFINLSLAKYKFSKEEYRISTVQDITILKEQQYELQKSRDRLLQAQQLAQLGYWTLEPDSRKLWWSDIVYDIYHKDKESFDPTLQKYVELCHPDDAEIVKKSIQKNIKLQTFELTHRIIRPDNDIGYVQVRGEKVFDDTLGCEIIRGAVLDITELKQIEKQLEEEQKRFEIAANITTDVVWEWNPVKKKLWWGEGIESVLGYKKEDYENNPDFWPENIVPEDRERVSSSMLNAEQSGQLSWTEEYTFFGADGSRRKIRDSAMILRDKNGDIIRIIGAMVDKTKEIEYQEALQSQSYRFEMIANSSNDVLYDWNTETGKVWWSDGWQSRFYFSEDEVEPTRGWWREKIHPDDRDKVNQSLRKASESDDGYWIEHYKLLNGKGEYSIVVDKGYFLKDQDGKNEILVGAISDVTADIKSKEELKASEEQYRLLFEQNPIPMWIYDPETLRFSTVNSAALKKYGYSLKEMLSMTILGILPKSEIEDIKQLVKENTAKKQYYFGEHKHRTKKGKKLTVEISTSEITYKGKKQRLVIAHDITEQRLAEERAISAIIEGEERERQRIAKELHDGLGQYLSASNMNLKSVYEDLPDIPAELSNVFKTGLDFLNHAISETRSISQNLLPKAIQDYGLELAAESLINHLRNNSSIQFYFYKNVNGMPIPDKVQINLYRILQEGLNNAIRHGKPEKIDVQLVYSNGEILMTIEDNGTGFDTSENSTGIGIRSMKTRVGAMSANLDIVSDLNRGTIISVVVPV
jgi:PAS domain S-box-containing protein